MSAVVSKGCHEEALKVVEGEGSHTTPQHHNTTTPQHHNTTTPQQHGTPLSGHWGCERKRTPGEEKPIVMPSHPFYSALSQIKMK